MTGELVDPTAAVIVEAFLNAVKSFVNAAEIQAKRKVLAALVSWILRDLEPAEQLVEAVRVVDVVIALQDGDQKRLAKAPRTKEYRVTRLLQLADEVRAVNEIGVPRAHQREVRHPVHDLLQFMHMSMSLQASTKMAINVIIT